MRRDIITDSENRNNKMAGWGKVGQEVNGGIKKE